MARTIQCPVSGKQAELAKGLYPHAKHKTDPKRYAGRWRFNNKTLLSQLKTSVIEGVDYDDPNNKMSVEMANQLALLLSKTETKKSETVITGTKFESYAKEFEIKTRKEMGMRNLNEKYINNFVSRVNHFAIDIDSAGIKNLTEGDCVNWWLRNAPFEHLEPMTYGLQACNSQGLRHFLGFLKVEKRVLARDFTNVFNAASDYRVRFSVKGEKKRQPMDRQEFDLILDKAKELGYDCLVNAMEISLQTSMRVGDICGLMFDEHVSETAVTKLISKSLSQRGKKYASTVEFDFKTFPKLKDVIRRAQLNRASVLRLDPSLPLYEKSPAISVIYHRYNKPYMSKGHTHYSQVNTDYITRTMKQVVKAVGLWDDLPDGQTPPTFHEIRSLAAQEMRSSGVPVEAIQQIMAHTDIKITKQYLNNNKLAQEGVFIKAAEVIERFSVS